MLKQIVKYINDIGFYCRLDNDLFATGGFGFEEQNNITNIIPPLFTIKQIKDELFFRIPISQKSFIKCFDDCDIFKNWFNETYPKLVKLSGKKTISLNKLDRYDKLPILVELLGEGKLE